MAAQGDTQAKTHNANQFSFKTKLKRISSNLSDYAIEEDKEENDDIMLLNPEEKASMSTATLLSPLEAGINILWQGVIFENVQSLRHFKDSKAFVDHVLKTCELHTVNDHFTKHILNYTPKISKMASSTSFGNTKQRMNLAQLTLVQSPNSPVHIVKRGSFPRVPSFGNQYHSIMDEFMKSFFFNPGFELLAGETPSDWNEHPKTKLFCNILVPKDDDDVNTEFLSYFAKELNSLWKILYRVVNKNVSSQPYRYSFIPLKHPTIFVPGGRFREVYYWDTFWIIQGLLCCGMINSSIRLVENLADLVERYGFVPNGTRKYYLTRSQPPLLTSMINEIYDITKDKKWLQSILPSLVKEYTYWQTPPIRVSIISQSDKNKKQYTFSRYYSTNTTPRPESYYEDRMSAYIEDEDMRDVIYQNIRAAAASGWDFSSRWYYDKKGAYGNNQIEPRKDEFNLLDTEFNDAPWMKLMDETSVEMDTGLVSDAAVSVDEEVFDEFAQQRIQFTADFNMAKLDTCNVIPVDLNIFLCKVEGYLSKFHDAIGDKQNAIKYKSFQNTRIDDMLAVLWDEENNQFRDWNFRYKCFGNLNMASNFSALWLQCDHKGFNEKQELMVESLNKSNLICGGGIVTTLYETGEQWDFPNCWAPLNSIIIEGLYKMGKQDFALKLANIWINNNYHTFLSSKKMHEKYHCRRYGTGGGGEYKPQFGFGWTNGVCLKLMERFGPNLILNQK